MHEIEAEIKQKKAEKEELLAGGLVGGEGGVWAA